MKTKTLAVVEIAIVLCSVFLVATLPAIAAGPTMQKVSANTITTASEDDINWDEIFHPRLDIYGNANEDDTIDMRDTTYIKLVIFGKKPRTDFADANHDGKISMLDVGQTKLVILGKEKELTIVADAEKILTLNMPIEGIAVMYPDSTETVITLGAADKVVGIDTIVNFAMRDFNEISGGQQQKVMIARALAQEADILIFDEPTSNLDIRHQLEVMELIKKLVVEKGISAIMAVHDLNLASRYADRVIMMYGGSIYSAGEPASVLIPENIAFVYGVEVAVKSEDGKPYIVPKRPIKPNGGESEV